MYWTWSDEKSAENVFKLKPAVLEEKIVVIDNDIKTLSSKELYRHLSEEYPMIKKLKEKLNLSIDF